VNSASKWLFVDYLFCKELNGIIRQRKKAHACEKERHQAPLEIEKHFVRINTSFFGEDFYAARKSMARRANTIPIPCLIVLVSLRKKKERRMVTKG
jgi:hypothetical protein